MESLRWTDQRRTVKLSATIEAYQGARGEHDRYRSWEHCYQYFQEAGPKGLLANPREASLQLAFYLASWGMYRGSTFLLQYAYTVHVPFVQAIATGRFKELWKIDLGSDPSHSDMVPLILELMEEIGRTYEHVALEVGKKPPTPTLVTKMILGTFGCVPACDELFLVGIKRHGMKYSAPNKLFLNRILGFCQDHQGELRREQKRIKKQSGVHYPLMKLIDMHFWQWGLDYANASRR